jgi:hypothetical protein
MTVREHAPITDHRYSVHLVKQCMRRVTRIDTWNRITEFIGKNTSQPKRLDQILSLE